METKKEELEGAQKGLGKEISQMEEEIQEIPEIKKDIKKAFLILVSTVLIAVLMKNILGLSGWWLVPISTLNMISVIAMFVLIVAFAKLSYRKGIKEVLERNKEKQKE